ncbi:hypothetical protein DFH07DRAFT_976015 [Mycena maculata]|uniref:NAD(P)-binding protein n=1 Tax=Mycena maculata TaxID=230809 RepID=A0AAD7KH27_9AGAR|nr:hypothetical protein DFH07DRAFT_976015 [Mycena maculata]
MKFSAWGSLKEQLAKQPPVVKQDLTGKTVCVLGANAGIGFQACKHLATMNPARMILACRSESRGQAAVDKLRAETGYTKAKLWLIDLSDFASVKRFGDQFEKDGGRLDILIANAAMENRKYAETKDGWEITVQVNHLSTAYTVLLLLPTMLRTAQEHGTLPRITLVSSDLHHMVTIDKEVRAHPGRILETLASPAYCAKRMDTHYSMTKLLNIFFVRELNARLGPAAPLIVNLANPGFSVSELRREIKGTQGALLAVLEKLFAYTTEEGARRVLWPALALPNNPDALRGQYTGHGGPVEPSDFVIGEEGKQVQKGVWEETMAILERLDSRILTTVDRFLS